jgi:hypothetical protein
VARWFETAQVRLLTRRQQKCGALHSFPGAAQRLFGGARLLISPSEAKQSTFLLSLRREVDCFAALAMTVGLFEN